MRYSDYITRLSAANSQEDVDDIVKAARCDLEIGLSAFARIMTQVKARRAELPERGEPK